MEAPQRLKACLFPGQGSQPEGLRRDASRIELACIEVAQPARLTLSVAVLHAFRVAGTKPLGTCVQRYNQLRIQ